MSVTIRGIGWVTAAGMGCGQDAESFSMPRRELPKLKRKDVFKDAYLRFGRIDSFSKLGLAAITFALRDAGLEEWEAKRPIGVVAATRYGCLTTDTAYFDTVVPDNGALASPNLFAYTLPNCFLGEAAIRFGLTGPSVVVNEETPDGLGGISMALDLVRWGECETIIAGVSDLERPEVATFGQQAPGSVFLVLDGSGSDSDGYGVLSRGEDGALLLDGAVVASVEALVNVCLKR